MREETFTCGRRPTGQGTRPLSQLTRQAARTVRPLSRITRPLAVGALLAVAFSLSCSRPVERPNIVIVVLDAVRRDHLGAEIAGSEGAGITPNVDAIAAEGTTFANAWANGPWTLPSHVSMFTGLLPSSHGCNGASFRFETDAPTLATLLGEAGYETVAFYSNPWLTDGLSGMLRGFDQEYVDPTVDLSILSSGEQGGPETVANIGDWLHAREPGKPFFMFVNLLEAHLPYSPSEAYRRKHLPDLPEDDIVTVDWAHSVNARLVDPAGVDWERVQRLYAGDVHAADSLLGEILQLLKAEDLDEDVVLFITSDHGENLGDHGFTDHQFGVFESLLAVPLVVQAPPSLSAGAFGRGTTGSGASEPAIRRDPVMLTDLYATVLDLAGVEARPPRPHSRSLLGPPFAGDRLVIAEYVVPGLLRDHLQSMNPSLEEPWLYNAYATVRSGDVRLTVGSDGSVELTDYSDDPLEHRHLEERGRILAEALSGVLPVPGSPSERDEIDPELRDALRSLGYLP